MQLPVYFDYAATTPLDPKVASVMCDCLENNYGNPASRTHVLGWKAEEAVENARNQIAELLNADSREIVFTSGATEANNLALKGAVEASNNTKPHIITSAIEHKAVLDTCAWLEKSGVEVSYLQPNSEGLFKLNQIENAIRDNTVLVSLMWVNNEIGVINDVAAIGKLLREKSILFHVDAAQALAKLDINLQEQNIDFLSASAHKMYGPKGVGALYVRRAPEVKIAAQIHGGGHERGMRSGTLATHQIVGFGCAAEIAKANLQEESARILALRNRLYKGIQSLANVQVNGSLEERVAGNLNISFADVDGETLLLSLRDLALSTGSACTSVTVEPSYVLKALGVSDELAHSALRISLGRFSTEEEVDFAIKLITQRVPDLRAAS